MINLRIYLIGMPGVGKSRTGRYLANKLNMNFFDLDDVITKKYGAISKIFEENGEAYFRALETTELKRLSLSDNFVMSCGGGIILNKDNKKYMPGLVYFLDANLDIIKEHLAKSETIRPLLKDNKLEDIYNERIKNYEYFYDYRVIYTNSEEACNLIINSLNLKKKKILVINGPNMNMLGKRNKDHYGSLTLDDISNLILLQQGFEFAFFQSNSEGAIIDKIQEYDKYAGIIINPAAYTHTSVAIHDALEMVNIPKVEVHLSDVDNREDYRKINFVRDVCDCYFTKEKEYSYLNAVIYLKNIYNKLS